jgi:hypothetical protein
VDFIKFNYTENSPAMLAQNKKKICQGRLQRAIRRLGKLAIAFNRLFPEDELIVGSLLYDVTGTNFGVTADEQDPER